MKKYGTLFALTGAVLGMGITMPSCPGQQEMQLQIDQVKAANADLNKAVGNLTNQLNAVNADMAQVKQLLPQMTNVIQSQKAALDQMDATVKDLQAKLTKLTTKKKAR